MYPVELAGPRLTLREMRVEDAPALLAVINDPRVFAHLLDAELAAEEVLVRQIEEARQRLREQGPRSSFNLTLVVGGAVVGNGNLAVHSAVHRRAEIGYLLHPDWWGQGLATEAARLLIGFGFGTLDLHRIEATTGPENRASARVLEKAGMRYEGRLRENVFVRGKWRDSLSYAVLATD
jgi:RimJ/RimL family protein N-acetyltransferase